MKTLLEIDDEVIDAARTIAARDGKTLDHAITDLARIGVVARSTSIAEYRHEFRIMHKRGESITPQHVRRLLDGPSLPEID